jgi:hypothetical protein
MEAASQLCKKNLVCCVTSVYYSKVKGKKTLLCNHSTTWLEILYEPSPPMRNARRKMQEFSVVKNQFSH